MFGDWVCAVIDDEPGAKRRPLVTEEDGSAEKLHEPGPVCVFVVVSGDVEAEPGSAVVHVVLEGGALRGRFGEVVEPEDQLELLESVRVAVVPVCRGVEREIVAGDRKSTRLNSSHLVISYAVFC